MYHKDELYRLRNELRDILDNMRVELKSLPKGYFYCRNINGINYYYERFPKVGNRKKERRIGITSDTEKIFELVRKKYILLAIPALEKDITLLDNLLNEYQPADEKTLMKEFVKKYPELEEAVFTNKLSAERWANAYEQDTDYYEKDLKLVSLDGTRMRSDGEVYIASRLNHYGIPYRYEAKLPIPDLSFHPDFTIMRPRDHKIIYWEHFGKIDNSEYVRNNLVKVDKYMQYGIVPWDNLIMSFNQRGGGFNAKLIDCLIQGWLL